MFDVAKKAGVENVTCTQVGGVYVIKVSKEVDEKDIMCIHKEIKKAGMAPAIVVQPDVILSVEYGNMLSFEIALVLLKASKKLTRECWNDKYLLLETVAEEDFFKIKYKDEPKTFMWAPMQADMMAQDWAIYDG